jgi:hypothetical protein
MSTMKPCILLLALIVAFQTPAWAQDKPAAENPDAAYTRVITDRAAKIVAALGITNAAKSDRVRDIIVQQYRDLSAIHDARDARIKAAKQSKDDKKAAEAGIQAARDEARARLDKLHAEYLAKLSTGLTPAQVDKVKDGMTYGVVQVTYHAYLEKYPDLTDAHKQQMLAWLVEARELAMDEGSSQEKHAVFGKFKGRINNFLSKAGYDLKTGSKSPAPSAAAPQTNSAKAP